MAERLQDKGRMIALQNVKSKILERISSELSAQPTAAADSHIKNDCDLHGKGDHIKGAGPNDPNTVTGVRPVDMFGQFYDQFVQRLADDVAARLKR